MTFSDFWKLTILLYLDFHLTKQGLPLVDSWSHGLDLNQMYHDRDSLIILRNTVNLYSSAKYRLQNTCCTSQCSFGYYMHVQRNPANTVINGPKKIDHDSKVPVLTRVS